MIVSGIFFRILHSVPQAFQTLTVHNLETVSTRKLCVAPPQDCVCSITLCHVWMWHLPEWDWSSVTPWPLRLPNSTNKVLAHFLRITANTVASHYQLKTKPNIHRYKYIHISYIWDRIWPIPTFPMNTLLLYIRLIIHYAYNTYSSPYHKRQTKHEFFKANHLVCKQTFTQPMLYHMWQWQWREKKLNLDLLSTG